MTTEEDFMRGVVRIKVDLPGLKADLEAAKALIKTHIGEASNLKIRAAGTGSAGTTRNQPGGSGGGAGSGGNSGPTSYSNAAMARSMRKASVIEERARTKELGRPVTKEMRLDARKFRKQLKAILDDDFRLSNKDIEIELKVLDKVFKRDFASSVSFIKKQEREAATAARQAAKQAQKEQQDDEKGADKAAAAARKEAQSRAEKDLKAHEDRKAQIIKDRRARNAPSRSQYASSKDSIEKQTAAALRDTTDPGEAARIRSAREGQMRRLVDIRRDKTLSPEDRKSAMKREGEGFGDSLKKYRAARKASQQQDLADQKDAAKAAAGARRAAQQAQEAQVRAGQSRIEAMLKAHEDRKAQIIKDRRARNAPVRRAYQSSVTQTGETALQMGDGLDPGEKAQLRGVHFRNRTDLAGIRRDPQLRGEAKERAIKISTKGAIAEMKRLRKSFLDAKAEMQRPIMLKVKRDKLVDGIKRDALRLRGTAGAAGDQALAASSKRAIRAIRALNAAAASLPKSKRIRLEVDADRAMREFKDIKRQVGKPITARVVKQPSRGQNLTRLFGGGAFVGGGGGRMGGGGGRMLGQLGSAAAASGPMGAVAAGAAVGAVATGAAAAGYVAVSKKIASDGLQRLALVQKYKTSLGVILKDQREANRLFTELEDLDIKLPIGLDVLAESAQKLAGSGVDPEKISAYVEAIANAGSVSVDGLNEGMSRITRALTQIRSKGKLEMEDLNQIAETGIPIRQMINEQFGMDADELRDAVKDGSMTMTGVMDGIVESFTKNYGGALEAQGETMLGQIDRLRDAYRKFAGEASEPLMESVQFALENIIDLFKDGDLDGALDPFVDGINAAAGAIAILGGNLDKLTMIINSIPGGKGKFVTSLLTMAGETGKELAEEAKAERGRRKMIEEARTEIATVREQERRDSLTPEQRAAEDEEKRQKELAAEKRSAFRGAVKDYESRTGLKYEGGNEDSAEGETLIKEFKVREAFQGVLDKVNEANDTDFKYDDFTEAEREKMRGRDSKNNQDEEKRKIIARRAAAAGMTVEEYQESQQKAQSGAVLGAARGAAGLIGQGLSAARGAMGGIIPGIDALTGGAASAVGGAFTMGNEETFNRAQEKLSQIREEAIANASTPEEKEALRNMKTDLKGFVNKDGSLRLDIDTEQLAKKDFSSQTVGFGDLNRAIQDKIDQAAQTKYAQQTAENTKTMMEKMVAFLDSLQGTNNAPKFQSPLGP